MGTIYSSKKFKEFVYDESVAEDTSRWKSAKSEKKKSRCGDSDVGKYKFLQSFAGGINNKAKKPMNESVIVHEIDEAVKERIYRSDAALQSSSSNYNLKTLSGSKCHDPRSHKAATDRLHLTDNEFVSIISDEDDDNSSIMSSNDLADIEGSSGEPILEHDITLHEMESSVVVYPEYVTYGGSCYWKVQLTFFCSSIKLDVPAEEEAMDCLTFEWKTVDLISIESRLSGPFQTAYVCLYIKSEHSELGSSGQKSGILEVNFTVTDPCWSNTQELIKSLDEQYKDKWDVDLDSYESFEDITYLEGDCGSISISKRDFQLLQPERFINDTIVDFYIEYLKTIKAGDARVHFFNSFFFRKLADFDESQSQFFDAKAAFQRVRKWTKKVNVFQQDYIFISVNFRLHWSLIVICHPGEVVNFTDGELANSLKVPCILHMDSIKGSHRGLEHCIRCYLWEEWKERNNDAAEDICTKFMDLRFLRLEVPQQQNSYDCGLFMLHYMELFVKHAPINFNPLNDFISKDWFYPKEASLKRTRIKKLIYELTKNNPKSPTRNENQSNELKNESEEESEVEILHETCNSKEMYSDTPIMVKPLRSECLNLKQIDVNVLDGDISDRTGILTSSLPEIRSRCEEFLETGDNGGLLIDDDEHNRGQMVLYDSSADVLSPIKESDEMEDVLDKQLVATELTEPPPTNSVTFIDKSLNLLQLKENSSSPSSGDDDVHEALVVEDSDCSSSSSDCVFETCVVDDSDSDDEIVVGVCKNSYKKGCTSSIRKDVAGNRLNFSVSKRRGCVVSRARKRLRRSS